jgi:alkylglycerol monooxygenase
MTPIYLLVAIPVLLLLTIAEMVYDSFRHGKRFSFQDTLTNLSCGFGNQGLNLFTEGLKLFLFIDIFYGKLAIGHIPHTWWSVLLCLFIFDFAFYWEHRLSHTINILWGTHVVHHSSEEYNLSIALRRSWLADVVVIIFFLPIPMMGFAPETFLTVVVIHNFYQFILHTKAIGKLPAWFSFAMHTPSHHRVHHGKDPKYIDKNFSGVFILYDRIFGTFKEEEEEPTYGITTQLTTNNPWKVNLHYYQDLFRTVGQVKGISNKLKLLFGPPGWFPEEMGGYKAPPPVDKNTYKKYSANTPSGLNAYVLVQFLMTFAGILLLLFNKKYMQGNLLTEEFEMLFFIILALSSVIPIALFDRHKNVGIMEYARLTLTYGVLIGYIFMQGTSDYPMASFTVITAFFALFVYWFARVWKNREGGEELRIMN